MIFLIVVAKDKWYTLKTDPFLDNNKNQKLQLEFDNLNSSNGTSEPYIRTPAIHKKHQGVLTMILIVKSYVLNIGQRIAIRNTWGKKTKHIQIVFVIGMETKSKEIIDHEIQQYDDLLQLRIHDTYDSLVYKTIYSIMWIANKNIISRYFHFVDDDRFVNVQNVLEFSMLNLKSTDVKMIGYKLSWATVHRNFQSSKYAITYDEYPYYFYPPYVVGGTLLTNYRTLRRIVKGMFSTKIITMEDCYLGMIAYRMSIRVEHSARFCDKPEKASELHRILSSPGYEKTYRLIAAWTLHNNDKTYSDNSYL